MTECLKTAIIAINKWFYFAMNYETISHEWESISGERRVEYLPRFLKEAKWTCNLDHMLAKWNMATQSKNPYAYLMNFYAELDEANRKALLEWVMENYNGERKIF